jgi:hypothetical protein
MQNAPFHQHCPEMKSVKPIHSSLHQPEWRTRYRHRSLRRNMLAQLALNPDAPHSDNRTGKSSASDRERNPRRSVTTSPCFVSAFTAYSIFLLSEYLGCTTLSYEMAGIVSRLRYLTARQNSVRSARLLCPCVGTASFLWGAVITSRWLASFAASPFCFHRTT